MGNVMTGRKAYGQYQDDSVDAPATRYEDPLVELARIVSEGDEFFRQDPEPHGRLRSRAADPGAGAPAGYPAGDPGYTNFRVADEVPSEAFDSQPDYDGYAGYDGYEAYAAHEAAPVALDPYQQAWPEDAEGGAFVEEIDDYDPIAETIRADEAGYGYDAPAEGGPGQPRALDIRLDPDALVDPAYDTDEVSAYADDGYRGYATPPMPPQVDDGFDDPEFDSEDPYAIDPREISAARAEAGYHAHHDAFEEEGEDAYRQDAYGYGEEADPGDMHHDLVAVAPQPDDFAGGQAAGGPGPGMKVMAAVLALLLVGGGGLYAYRSLSGTALSGPPPVIKADNNPVKERPNERRTAANTAGSGVYERLSGESGSDKSQERIVVGREAPVDVARNADAAEGAPAISPSIPKQVRTIVVKPDGTFITNPAPSESEDAAGAGEVQAAELAVELEKQPAGGNGTEADQARVVTTTPIRTVPTTRQSDEAAGSDAAAEGTTATEVAVGTRAENAAERIENANPPVATSLVEAGRQGDPTVTGRPAEAAAAPAEPAAAPADAISVTPRRKPELATGATRTARAEPQPAAQNGSAPLDVRPSATDGRTRSVAPQPEPAPAPAATQQAPRAGGFVVQVSSQRSQDQAQEAYADLQRRFPSVLGGKQPVIEKADIGNRGTFYRVGLGPYERSAAAQLCESLKSAGGECFIRSN